MKPGFPVRNVLLFAAFLIIIRILGGGGLVVWADPVPEEWVREWPRTDFSRSSVEFSEILSGGPPKDGIPAIDNPRFRPAREIRDLDPREPVIVLNMKGEARAYPLRILMWHEIVNDQIGDVPVAVTYCPLCNAAVAFDRRIEGRVLDFGVSGKLRHSDMVMYDRQTESWWQQFVGEGIVGVMTGMRLRHLPAVLRPFSAFRAAFPGGRVLIPPDRRVRPYGDNPYAGYDRATAPFLYDGRYDGPGLPLSYVISVGKEAWLLEDIRRAGRIDHGNLRLEWRAGMNSALDSRRIAKGRDIGFVNVRRLLPGGSHEEVPHHMTFAFAFKAFHPDGVIHSTAREDGKAPSP